MSADPEHDQNQNILFSNYDLTENSKGDQLLLQIVNNLKDNEHINFQNYVTELFNVNVLLNNTLSRVFAQVHALYLTFHDTNLSLEDFCECLGFCTISRQATWELVSNCAVTRFAYLLVPYSPSLVISVERVRQSILWKLNNTQGLDFDISTLLQVCLHFNELATHIGSANDVRIHRNEFYKHTTAQRLTDAQYTVAHFSLQTFASELNSLQSITVTVKGQSYILDIGFELRQSFIYVTGS